MSDVMDGLSYLSKMDGIGGCVGAAPEDFIVEEIMMDGKALPSNKRIRKAGSGDYTSFVLKKRMWSTQDALQEISHRLGIPMKRLSVAGNKDRRAITVQLVSCWGITPDAALGLDIKDMEILGAWRSERPISTGDLIGNRFTLRIAGAEEIERADAVIHETEGMIPNYFGPQRFGLRGNNHVVGKLLVQGRTRDSVMEFISGGEDESEEARNARRNASEDGINEATLALFPKRLTHERALIAHLIKRPDDYVGALRKLPRNLQLMIVQSYQSWLFNSMLSERIKEGELEPKEGGTGCGYNKHGFVDPESKGNDVTLGKIIGYDSVLTSSEEDVMWREGIEPSNFRLRHLPELSARGFLRPLLVNIKGLNVSRLKDGACTLRFSLPKGSYATVAARELLDKGKQPRNRSARRRK